MARVAGAIVGCYQRGDILPTRRDVDEHRGLADAIAGRAGEVAGRLMHDHLKAQRDELRTHRPDASRPMEEGTDHER